MNKTRASLDALDIGMRNAVAFTKMQALGNDFVFLNETDLQESAAGQVILENLERNGAELARTICDRHFGIGADGLIFVRRSQRPDCDVSWLYINSDGSQSLMCGNGLRCLGLYCVSGKLVRDNSFKVETGIGPVPVRVVDEADITTDLGEPILDGQRVPAGRKADKIVREPLCVGETTVFGTCVSMGNPHCVIFETREDLAQWRQLSPQIQQLAFFPEGVNVEFVTAPSRKHAKVFVWERGCGPTLACASGAAAVLVAGVLEGKLDRDATIELPGGPLQVSWSEKDSHVRITGPATIAYRGVLDLSQYWQGGDA